MFKKYPEKIIKGTIRGPDKARAAFEFGAIADKKDPLTKSFSFLKEKKFKKMKLFFLPYATDVLATRITMQTQIINLEASLFRLAIQYRIVTNINGKIMNFGDFVEKS